jgi:hypothetical protein
VRVQCNRQLEVFLLCGSFEMYRRSKRNASLSISSWWGGQQLCVFGFFISIFNTISIDNNNNVWSFLVFSSCYRICVYGNVGQFPLVFVCYWVIGSATTFIMFQIYGSFCVFLDSIENVKSNNGVTIIFYFVVFFCVSIIFSNCWFFILRLLATTSSSDHFSSISFLNGIILFVITI